MSDSFEIHVFRARDGVRWRASIVDAGGYYLIRYSFDCTSEAALAADSVARVRAAYCAIEVE